MKHSTPDALRPAAYPAASVLVSSPKLGPGSGEEFDAADLRCGVGVGVSVLDGLLRVDLCRDLIGPEGEFRVEVYLDGSI